MSDFPVRRRSVNGRPAEELSIARTCRRCEASFRKLAPGSTGERGLWSGWGWWCSIECYNVDHQNAPYIGGTP